MSGGAITPPTAVPALMIPIAVARSFVGNHSATARVAAGKPPPSPIPSKNLLPVSMAKLVASAWLAFASDQNDHDDGESNARSQAIDKFSAARYMNA